jgi:hypothetical protein
MSLPLPPFGRHDAGFAGFAGFAGQGAGDAEGYCGVCKGRAGGAVFFATPANPVATRACVGGAAPEVCAGGWWQ